MVTKETTTEKGIKFTKPTAQVQAPFAGREEEEEFRKPLPPREELGVEEKIVRAGKLPLHPAVIRLPFSILGRVGTELTGYSGFTFTERELADLSELWVQCGILMNPMLQASIGTTAMVGAKFIGYGMWVKAGKPSVRITAEGEPIWEKPKEGEETE